MNYEPFNKVDIMKKWSIPMVMMTIGMLFSCGNSMEEIKEVSYSEEGPSETSEGVTMYFTDKGVSKLKLESPLIESYKYDEEVKMECPKGMTVTFYDSLGEIQSKLQSKYGVLFSKKEYLKVEDSVVFENYKKEKLETNLLHIDFKKDCVYTHEKVKVSSPDAVLNGVGLQANGNFTKYNVKHISNSFYTVPEEDQPVK